MNLKRYANIVSAVAGTALLAGAIGFMIAGLDQPDPAVGNDRILNVGVARDEPGEDRGLLVSITVTPDGTFVVDGEIMPDEELLRKLKTMARVAANADVRIRGVEGTSWDTMTRAVDLIETTGLTNVTFETRKPLPE